MTKVVVDVMGGDNAPEAILDGIVHAFERDLLKPENALLTGPTDVVRAQLSARGIDADSVAIHDAPDVLSGSETPVDAMRKMPRNSIAVGIELVRDGKGDAFVSAGNTGCVVAAATMGLRRLKGIRRAGIAVTIEGEKGPFTVVDVGANSQPKAEHLLHYGIMGAAYHRDAFGTPEPKVGLMNIGSEDGKGSPLVKEASELLRRAPINFVGNVEGVELFSGACDVIVSDGFTGNVLLKVSEGVAEYMLHTTKKLMAEAQVSPEQTRQVLGNMYRKVDYSEYGGALLLGVDGIVTICHGRSGGNAIASAIRFAAKAVDAGLNRHIVDAATEIES